MNFTLKARDVDGNEITLSRPSSIVINSSVDAPADSMTVILPCSFAPPELCEISLSADGSLAFSGIVDEQTVYYSGGLMLRIDARSSAALLLDNEALPATYNSPSLADIYSLHAQNYGIKGFVGSGVCNGDFSVKKGMSEWEVIESFCRSVMGVQPVITKDLILDARENKTDEHYVFSNEIPGAVGFSEATLRRKRYGEISEILYKLSAGNIYDLRYENADAAGRGISSRRLLNLSENDGKFNEYRIKNIISKSRQDAFELKLTLPDICVTTLFAGASVYDGKIGNYENLLVKEADFSLSQKGVFTRLTLCPEENISIAL